MRLPACEYSNHRLLEMGSRKERLKRMSTEPMIKGTEMLVCLTSFSIHDWMLCMMLNAAIWERVMRENDMDLSWAVGTEEGCLGNKFDIFTINVTKKKITD